MEVRTIEADISKEKKSAKIIAGFLSVGEKLPSSNVTLKIIFQERSGLQLTISETARIKQMLIKAQILAFDGEHEVVQDTDINTLDEIQSKKTEVIISDEEITPFVEITRRALAAVSREFFPYEKLNKILLDILQKFEAIKHLPMEGIQIVRAKVKTTLLEQNILEEIPAISGQDRSYRFNSTLAA